MSFERYSSADTVAELYDTHASIHPDFSSFVGGRPTHPDSVDLNMLENPTPEKTDFLRRIFSTKFHVIWRMFDTYPFGPGNYLMCQFNQTSGSEIPDELQFIQMGRESVTRDLGTNITVTSSSIAFSGAAFEVVFRETEHEVGGVRVFNLLGTKAGRVEYNYYFVPITF